ncbi:MAG TPA: hypothetical protein VGK92_06870, partial [Gaiellales bacterium]
KGDKGDTGATGAASTVAGPKGDTGSQGIQGLKGDTGPAYVPVYNTSGVLTSAHTVTGGTDLAFNSHSANFTLSGNAAFATTSYVCTLTDSSNAAVAVTMTNKATNGFTLNVPSANNGDVIAFTCTG